MKMAEKTNQHFVPQFYFRFFSNDGKSICMLNRKNGNAVNTAQIEGQASKKYFYGENLETENFLAETEGFFSSVLKKLKANLNLEEMIIQ